MAQTDPHRPPPLPLRAHDGQLKRIGVGSVVGDELFQALIFLGTARSLPAHWNMEHDDHEDDHEDDHDDVDHTDDDSDDGDDDSGEFGVVLRAFPLPMR